MAKPIATTGSTPTLGTFTMASDPALTERSSQPNRAPDIFRAARSELLRRPGCAPDESPTGASS
jgi:hypothetical protein